MTRPRVVWLGVVLAALVGGATPLRAQKTDVVVLPNGDRITGEIKGVSRGKLDYSTDDAGRISIEWEKVVRITSRQSYEVTLRSGQRLIGSLVETEQDGYLAVSGASVNAVPVRLVVNITPLRDRFWRRLKGTFDLGFSYAKANQNVQFSASGDLRYRPPRWEAILDFNDYFQQQKGTESVTRNTISALVQWFAAPRWSVGGLSQYEQNDELGLTRRNTFGALGMRSLLESNRAEFRVPAGVLLSSEQFTGSDSVVVSMEAFVGLDLLAFRFDSPKLDFGTSAFAYPSLTESGRVRLQLTSRVKYELFKDFHVGIRLTDSYDSKPPGQSGSRNDFTGQFTIGWSFHQ